MRRSSPSTARVAPKYFRKPRVSQAKIAGAAESGFIARRRREPRDRATLLCGHARAGTPGAVYAYTSLVLKEGDTEISVTTARGKVISLPVN